MVSVEIRNISKRFGSATVLSSVSLAISSGDFFFILGPSGCGKSTLLRLMAGLETLDSGEILFDGSSVATVPPHKRGLGFVFQNYALWPHMTVSQNVAFGPETQRCSAQEIARRTEEALALVRMGSYANRYPAQLSGGQQQRVALARALAIKPKLILLDEPLSNLDARLREEIRGELRRLHETLGITMVYVTHDQEDALTLATKIALFRNGSVEQVGSPRDVYERPTTRYSAEFLGGANLIPCVLKESNTHLAAHSLATVQLKGALSNRTAQGLVSRIDPRQESFLCVRPESVRIYPQGLPGDNCSPGETLPAVVRHVAYKGSHLLVECQLADGTVMLANAGLDIDPSTLGQGAPIGLSWSPTCATLLNA